MDPQLTEAILQAIELTTSGSNPQTGQTEGFLMKTHLANPAFFVALFQICVDEGRTEAVRLAATVVLKQHITKNWAALGEEVRALFKVNILDLACHSKSMRVGRLMAECFYDMLLKNQFPKDWPEAEELLFQRLLHARADVDRLYFLLLNYSKLAKLRENLMKEERKEISDSVKRFFPFLLELAGGLISGSESHRPAFLHLIAKVFYKSFKFELDEYIRAREACDKWFGIFRLVIKDYKNLPAAAKWFSRLLIALYRNSGNPKINKDAPDFALFWQENWGAPLFQDLLEVIYSFDRATNEPKIVKNISRAYFHIARNPFYLPKFLPPIEKLFYEKLFALIVLSETEFDELLDNPQETFKATDDFYNDESLRYSLAGILVTTANEGHLTGELLSFCQKVIVERAALVQTEKFSLALMEKEAAYFLIEKLVHKLHTFKGAKGITASLIQNYLLPDLGSPNDVARFRAASVVKALLKEQDEEETELEALHRALAEQLCRLLQDRFFPVKGVAALSLQILLKNQSNVLEFIRPHLQDLLGIYVSLIDESDSEMLINSLTEIFECFGDDLGPHAARLLHHLCAFLVKLSHKQNDENGKQSEEELEQGGFAMLSTFGSIAQVLKSTVDATQIETFAQILFQMFAVLLVKINFEIYEEVLSIAGLLVFKSEKGKLAASLWQFFEFICYSLCKEIPIPAQPKNQFFGFIKDRESFLDTSTEAINVLRNFVFKGPEVILQGTDEQGLGYFHLLLKTLESLKSQPMDTFDESHRFALYFFKADLLFELRGRPDVLSSVELVKSLLIESMAFVAEKSSSFISVNTFLHSLGICFAIDPLGSFAFLQAAGMGKELLSRWLGHHQNAATFRVRKASFLGLLSLAQQTQQADSPLLPILAEANIPAFTLSFFLMREIAKMQRQYEKEGDMMDSDDLADFDDEDEVSELPSKPVLEESLAEFEVRLKALHELSVFDIEFLLNYEAEFVQDSFNQFNHAIALKIFLEQIGQSSPDLLAQLYAGLDKDSKGDLMEAFDPKKIA